MIHRLFTVSKASIIIFMVLQSSLVAKSYTCGTQKLIEHSKHLKEAVFSKTLAKTLTNCPSESYYKEVKSLKSSHFIFYYTLEGPHATTTHFLDTLVHYFEKAWTFNTQIAKLKAPKATKKTYHYQQNNESGLYAIEVIDIDLLRDTQYLMGGACHGCFGLTYPSDPLDPEASQILIDNDFKYSPSTSNTFLNTQNNEGENCKYPYASEELKNTKDSYSYAEFPNKGIQITAFHELYHASQLRYLNILTTPTFWLEASAVGVEEVNAPDIDDYWNYIPNFLENIGTPLSALREDYGACILYLYLFQNFGAAFDQKIWEFYSKNPKASFIEAFSTAFSKQNTDSLFHDFALSLFHIGNRSSSYKALYLDSPDWETPRIRQKKHTPLPALSFDFIDAKSTSIDLFSSNEEISLVYWDIDKKTTVSPIQNQQDWKNQIQKSDSAVYILSLLKEKSKNIEEKPKQKPILYPNPWQGGSLCFTGLSKQNTIEIRNRIGQLVWQINTNNSTHCLSEKDVKEKLSPSLYYYRVDHQGKTKAFLIVY